MCWMRSMMCAVFVVEWAPDADYGFCCACRGTAAVLATAAPRTTVGGGCALQPLPRHPHLHPQPAPTQYSRGVSVEVVPVLVLLRQAAVLMHLGATSAAPLGMLASGTANGELLVTAASCWHIASSVVLVRGCK